jgi:hypothetical protein
MKFQKLFPVACLGLFAVACSNKSVTPVSHEKDVQIQNSAADDTEAAMEKFVFSKNLNTQNADVGFSLDTSSTSSAKAEGDGKDCSSSKNDNGTITQSKDCASIPQVANIPKGGSFDQTKFKEMLEQMKTARNNRQGGQQQPMGQVQQQPQGGQQQGGGLQAGPSKSSSSKSAGTKPAVPNFMNALQDARDAGFAMVDMSTMPVEECRKKMEAFKGEAKSPEEFQKKAEEARNKMKVEIEAQTAEASKKREEFKEVLGVIQTKRQAILDACTLKPSGIPAIKPPVAGTPSVGIPELKPGNSESTSTSQQQQSALLLNSDEGQKLPEITVPQRGDGAGGSKPEFKMPSAEDLRKNFEVKAENKDKLEKQGNSGEAKQKAESAECKAAIADIEAYVKTIEQK